MAVPFQTILRVVARERGVALPVLLSPDRRARVCAARHEACWLARQLTDLSLAQIGRRLARDHTTVLHSVIAVETLRAMHADVRADLDELRAAVLRAAAPLTPHQEAV